MANYIATQDTTNPQELAESIMQEALLHFDGEAKDDDCDDWPGVEAFINLN